MCYLTEKETEVIELEPEPRDTLKAKESVISSVFPGISLQKI